MPLTPLSGALGKKRAAHLLRRACTGGSIADIDAFATMTPTEALQVLIREDLPTPLPPIDPMTGTEWITNGPIEDVNSGNLDSLLNGWIIGQMMASGIDESMRLSYSFRERMVFFLHTHFTTQWSKVESSQAIYYQNALLRHFAFDMNDIEIPVVNPDPDSLEILPPIIYKVNIKELAKKISVDNAMLILLDGRLNVKGNPNENYARELMELYTIGRGLEGSLPKGDFDGDYYNYTEQDVQAGAKVLSGFDYDKNYSNIDIETGLPRGIIKGGGNIAGSHDNSSKTFSFRYDNTVVAPDPTLLQGSSPTEESLLDEISQLIEMIFVKDETAINFCRKIYRFFIYHEVDEAIQNSIISDLAQVFKDNDYKIIPVMEALLTSKEFYEGVPGVVDDSFGGIIKSPLDLTIGFVKNFGISVPDHQATPALFYDFTGSILSAMNGQGLNFYEPFEVSGYSAYHQYPIFNRSWISPNYLTNRYDFIKNRVTPGNLVEMGDINPLLFVRVFIPNAIAQDAKLLIVALAEYFLPMSDDLSFDVSDTSELTQERMTYFLTSFLGVLDADPEGSWTANWNSGAMDEDKADSQLANLFNALFQTPEYQLM